MQRKEKQEGGKEERGNDFVDLPPTNSWNLSLPSHCGSFLHEIKNFSFSVEDSHETINKFYETLLNVTKNLQSVVRKENVVILEPTGKNSDLKQKIPKMSLYNLTDSKY